MSVAIYGLFDPRNGHLRYVGKSIDVRERVNRHIRKAKAGCPRHLRRWIASLLVVGLAPEVFIFEQADADHASDLERYWIAAMRFLGCDLVNLTSGGDGQSSGYRPSPQALRNQSLATRGKSHSATHRAAIAAKLGSEHLRERKRALMKERWETDHASLAKFKVGRKGRKSSPECVAKQSGWWTPERKAERSAKYKGRKRSQEAIEKTRLAKLGKPCLAGRKPHNVSPEGRARLREKMLGNRYGVRPC
jgi:GIY-YIG catalytic domain